MKAIHTIAIAAVSLPAFFSCTEKELQIREPDETPMVVGENQMGVTIRGIDEVFSWKSGDGITVIGDNGTEKFSILDTYTTTRAKFSGTDMESSRYTVIYSSHGETVDELESRSYRGQEQSANGSTGHLDFDIVLKDVSSYKNVIFSEEWASENGGELLMSNCLKFNLEFPGNVLELSSFGLRSDSPIFHTDNSVSSTTDSLLVTFPEAIDVAVNDNRITVYMLASWQPIQITEENEIKVWALYGDRSYLATLPAMSLTMKGGSIYEFNISADAWELYDMSEGSKLNPYKMATAEDLMTMSGKMKDNAMTYFSLTEDIDMTGKEWSPLQTDASAFKSIYFDGQGHKISNLTVNGEYEHASFAGILDGTIKNVTFENPSVTSTLASASTAAIVAGYAGRPNGESSATIENVTITGATLSVTQQTATPAGIIAGQARNLTVKDCKADGTVTHAGANAECNIGGFAGKLDEGCSITSCSAEIDVTILSQSRVLGTFVGSIRGASSITDCTAKGNLNAEGTARYSGGLVGYIDALAEIRNCTMTGNISNGTRAIGGLSGAVSKNSSGTTIYGCSYHGDISSENDPLEDYAEHSFGGMVGMIQAPITITACNSEGNFILKSNDYVGGIAGHVEAGGNGTVIERCSYKGTIGTTNRSCIAGIAGRLTGATTIRNCWTEGNITDVNHSVGGIVGNASTNSTIENCFSTMEIRAGHGIGGIVGRADNYSNDASESGLNIRISGCIAWNASISSKKMEDGGINVEKNHSGGAVVGRTDIYNINENCYRRADMTLSCHGNERDELYDQENSDANTPLVLKYSGKYYVPYHGKAAAPDATISSVARQLGWDELIWDLSGDTPVLK